MTRANGDHLLTYYDPTIQVNATRQYTSCMQRKQHNHFLLWTLTLHDQSVGPIKLWIVNIVELSWNIVWTT